MKRFLALAIGVCLTSCALAASKTLTWTAPTLKTNNQAITASDIAGWVITVSRKNTGTPVLYTLEIDAAKMSVTIPDDLPATAYCGTYFIFVQARLSNGLLDTLSAPVTFIAANAVCPGPVPNFPAKPVTGVTLQ
jgi:hypothetical protein